MGRLLFPNNLKAFLGSGDFRYAGALGVNIIGHGLTAAVIALEGHFYGIFAHILHALGIADGIIRTILQGFALAVFHGHRRFLHLAVVGIGSGRQLHPGDMGNGAAILQHPVAAYAIGHHRAVILKISRVQRLHRLVAQGLYGLRLGGTASGTGISLASGVLAGGRVGRSQSKAVGMIIKNIIGRRIISKRAGSRTVQHKVRGHIGKHPLAQGLHAGRPGQGL